VRLAPDLSQLTAGERRAVDELLAAGEVFQRLYEDALHHQAATVRERLAEAPPSTRPEQPSAADTCARSIASSRAPSPPRSTTGGSPSLASIRRCLAATSTPWGIAAEEVEAFVKAHPERREEILGERTVVRRAAAANLDADRATLVRRDR
jgi:hypothetical protein